MVQSKPRRSSGIDRSIYQQLDILSYLHGDAMNPQTLGINRFLSQAMKPMKPMNF